MPAHALARHSQRYLTAAALTLLVLASFLLQTFLFTTDFRPDEWRAIHVFLERITGFDTFEDEIWVRTCLTLFNLVVVLALHAVRLIDDRTVLLALVWPLALFLFSKIYWEFFVFPLCLIRFDLPRKQEALVLAVLVGLLAVTGEGNLGVLVIWRAVLLAQKFGFKRAAPAFLIVAGLALDVMLSTGIARSIPLIGSELSRFSWTRDIVNPEYSLIETAAVFVSSFHFFSLHNGAYWIDALFSLLVLAVIFNAKDAWWNLKDHAWTLITFVSVVFFFTSVTHAFQNARYYFFFLPLLAAITPPRKLLALGVVGILHVGFRGLSL
ncbi:hypothetical protein E4Z66_16615 [Aliishimia ponticola]|uniref:EpsG family protein n=1 Tax=Aliishimia ponticola TaxID=2499833 RepID=A0A4S4N8A4_9RHOB|nr:hypothetical protein [Aliishimia ponticola]THH35432.1 hypothetical protein E4Z66_16615 [Aliishimia ponticola]